MTPRKMFLTTALSGILFMSLSSLSQPSYAAEAGETLAPLGNWSFSEETQGDKTVGPYCMMAQKYKQNVFLVFAENLKGERSVAFDFQKNKFDPSRTYSVSLDSGADELRSYDVKPISDHVFVVRFGRDAAFFDAMNQSEKLSVEFAGEHYNFTLKNTKQGWQQVGDCIATISSSSSSSEPSNLVASMPSSEALVDPVDISDAVIEPPLAPELLPLSVVSETPKALKAAQVVSDAVSKKSSDVTAEHLATLKAENERLKKELTNMAKIQSSIVKSNKLKEAAVQDAVSNEVAVKSEALQAELNAALDKVKALEEKLEVAGSENDSKQDKIIQSEMAYLKKENARLIKELEAYDSDVSSDLLRDERDMLAKKALAFESDLKLVQREKARLATEMDRMRLAIENGQIESLPGDWDTVQATKRYQESQREIRRLGAALEKEKVMCEQEKKDIEQMLFDPELASGAQIYLINSMETKLKESEQKVSALENDLAKAKVELMSSKGSKNAGFAEIEALKQELVILRERQKDDQAKYLKAQNDIKALKETQTPVNGTEMISLKEDIIRLTLEATKYQEQIAEKVAMIEALQNQTANLQKQVASLTVKSDDTTKDIKMNLLEEENARLQSELKEQLTLLPVKERTVKELETQIESLKSLVAEQEARLNQKDTSLKSLEEKTSALQSDMTERLSASSQYQNKIKALEEENIELQAALEKVFEKVPVQSAKLSALKQKNNKLVSELEKQLKTAPLKETKIKTLEQEVATLRSALNQTKTSFAGKDERIKVLEQSLITAQAQLQENAKAQKEAASAKAQLATLEKRYETLRKDSLSYKNTVSNALAYNNIVPAAGNSQPVQEKAVSVETHAVDAHYMNEKDLAALLKKASIAVTKPIKNTTKVDGMRSYRWQTGPLYGSLEMKELGNIKFFDTAISSYLEKTRGRCKGEFAAMPGNEFTSFGGKMKTYEIACVSGNVRSSAALLFYSRGPVFTVMAHEGAASYMQDAMNVRDKLIEALKR